jgi:serine/threonine-protein kinase
VNQVGRYQILEELGRGACGVVYRALDPAIGRTVAIKSIRFSEFSDPAERRDLRERVLREAQSAGKLSHPNIVTIYDVLESEDLAYIFMEFVDGPSLKDAMQRDTLPGRDQTLSILGQLAAALDYAHRKGIIHRDIKPANIMISDRGIDKDGVAKISDFGIAKLISHEATHQRAFMGTPSYMSPEQLEGVSVGGASDQFALAVVVYLLLTGQKPFAAENLAALQYLICKRPAQPVHELNTTLNETVNRVMERALAKLPEERYPSCSEFIGALSFAIGECPEWRPVTPKKSEEIEKPPGGSGWYAPETVISSRLLEGESAGDLEVLDPVVLPPEPHNLETAVSTRVASEEARAEYQSAERERGVRSSAGTRVRVGVERPAARTWGLTMAACAAVTLLGIFFLRSLSSPATNLQDLESKRVVAVGQPEDLSSTNNKASSPPADLIVPPVATPISTDSSDSSTTVAVRTPAARQVQAAPRNVEAPPVTAPPQPLKPVRQPAARLAPVPVPIPVAPASVELVSDPPGARIEVDGRSALSCLAPCNVSLGPGRHTLFAELGGYGTARKIFNVPTAGGVFVSMMRNMGILLLTSQPAGANVFIDGKDYGATPVEIKLSAGRHHLSLSDGSRHHDETIQIDTDGVYARSFRW